MLKTAIFSSLLTLSIFLPACSKDTNNNTEQENKNVNSIITKNEYTLTGLDATKYSVTKEVNGFSLANAEGKVVIFDIFATWCPPCRATAPHLSALQKKYKNDLVVIGITIEEGIDNNKLLKFRTEFDANYTLVNSEQNRRLVNVITTELELGDRFPIPIMVLYKDGKLIKHYIGLVEEEFIESDIKRALGK